MKPHLGKIALVITFSSVINPRKGCAQQSLNGVFYMKKNVLALSISAALCGLGMVGSAHAVTDLGVTGSIGNATALKANNDGIGHNLIVPYYTAQGKNATAFTLTNTTATAKAVKIRFRGAENSDDVLDFQVFLSPQDVWTASISQSATGEAMITTSDASCTKPSFTAGVGVNFKTGRLSAATNVAGTREGYIEIFNMADAPGVVANTVGAAVTHVAATGKPTCTGTGYTALDSITDNTTAALTAAGVGLTLPTTGLSANWIIINTTTGTSWSGQAQATQALNGTTPGTGNLVYWPQLSTAVVHATAGSSVNGLTADPLLQAGGAVAATMQDLPDMSTPYIAGLILFAVGAATNLAIPFGVAGTAYGADADGWAARRQASRLSASLAVMSVNNDFYVDSAIGGATDWAFSMPTRRYNVAVNYTAPVARVFTDYTFGNVTATTGTTAAIGGFTPVNYFTAANTNLSGNVTCVTGISPTVYNREEGSLVVTTSTTFSPSTAPAAVSFCGEVGVWGLGQTLPSGGFTSVLGSGIPNVAQTVGVNNYGAGWMNVGTTGIGGTIGLPVVGAAFSKASSDPAKTYGWSQPHTSTRVAGYVY